MAIALVQNKATFGNGSSSPLGLAFASSPTAGNLLIAICGGDSAAALSVSDTNTNTWSNGPTTSSGGDGKIALFYAANCKGGATTVNFAWSGVGASDPHLWIAEYSGVATTSPLDASGSLADTSSTTSHSVTTSGAITNGGDLLVAGFLCWSIANTYTQGTGFTLEGGASTNYNNTTGGDSQGTEDEILSGASLTTKTASITFASAAPSMSVIAAFLPGAGGATHFDIPQLGMLGVGF